MQFNLLQSKPNGDFPLPLQVVIVLLSLVLASLLFLAVRSHIPVTSGAAQLALVALFVAAVPGYITLFSIVLKVFQGARVQPTAEP